MPFGFEVAEEPKCDHLPGENPGETLGKQEPKAFFLENCLCGLPGEFVGCGRLDAFHLRLSFTARDILNAKENHRRQHNTERSSDVEDALPAAFADAQKGHEHARNAP